MAFTIKVTNLKSSKVTVRATLMSGVSRAINIDPTHTVEVDRDIVIAGLSDFLEMKHRGLIWFDENEVNLGGGSTGVAGPTGPSGGPQGVTGAQGVTGTGATGLRGPTGLVGPAGPAGVTGPAGGGGGGSGATGLPGPTGAVGPAGATGAAGVGFTGLQGAQGVTGTAGSIGATGAAGAGFTGLQGAQGVTGTAGAAGAAGATGAAGLVGATGLVGPQGLTGPQGMTGLGITGPQGITGNAGTRGFTGAVGVTGAAGFQGTTGLGVTGPSGGPQGATGLPGPAGGEVSQYLTFDGGNVRILASGSAGALGTVTATKDFSVAATSKLILGVPSGVFIKTVHVVFTAAETVGRTNCAVEMPEPNGALTALTSVRPNAIRWSQTSTLGGAAFNSTIVNLAGVITVTLASYTAAADQKMSMFL
jgi:hypothetical protein